MYRKFLLTFEKILLLSFSSTATHFDITKRITNHLRKHFAKNLISEGTTSHWVEYNDGCAQRYGIHSLLFVIILFSHLIFLLRRNRYMVCSKSLMSFLLMQTDHLGQSKFGTSPPPWNLVCCYQKRFHSGLCFSIHAAFLSFMKHLFSQPSSRTTFISVFWKFG